MTTRIPIPPLRIHARLLLAFALVLAPLLGLLVASSLYELRQAQKAILEAQAMTAHSAAVQVTEVFDSAIGFGWAVAQDPVLQSLDPGVINPHLRKMVERSPLYASIRVYDSNGLNRGWGDSDEAVEPRPGIGDRRFFQQVMETNAPLISEVVELRDTQRTGLLVNIPLRGPLERPIGVVTLVLRADQLAERFLAARLQQMQMLFLADPRGRLAFHLGASHLPYAQSGSFMDSAPLQQALAGVPNRVTRLIHPFTGDEHLGAFAPVPRYPWAIGVSIPRDVALAPLIAQWKLLLPVFAGTLLLSAVLALRLARFYAHPVQQLQAAARALERGEPEPRVHIHTGDELEELGRSFNAMAAEVTRRNVEVKALHAEAERQALELAAIIASVPDALFLANPEGQVVGTNPAGLRLLGLRSRSELNMPWSEYLQRYDLRDSEGRQIEQAERPLVRALEGETFTDVKVRLRSAEGQQLLFSVNGAPVRDASGRIILGIILLRDITHRWQEEEALRHEPGEPPPDEEEPRAAAPVDFTP